MAKLVWMTYLAQSKMFLTKITPNTSWNIKMKISSQNQPIQFPFLKESDGSSKVLASATVPLSYVIRYIQRHNCCNTLSVESWHWMVNDAVRAVESVLFVPRLCYFAAFESWHSRMRLLYDIRRQRTSDLLLYWLWAPAIVVYFERMAFIDYRLILVTL